MSERYQSHKVQQKFTGLENAADQLPYDEVPKSLEEHDYNFNYEYYIKHIHLK